jgi:HEAT repeat protein
MPLRHPDTPSPQPDQADTVDPISVLADPDADRRRWAALELDGNQDAVPALLARVGVETSRVVRDALLTTLEAHDTELVAQALMAHLATDDAALRVAVAGALATMTTAVPPLLAVLVADPDADVRIMTAMILADLASPVTQDWLVRMIETDPHPNVVAAAIDAFLPLAAAEHVDLFERAADRFPDDPFLRFTVDSIVPRLIEARP